MLKILHVLAGLFLLALAVVPIYSQSDANLPLPEYYGIYAIVDGKLCGITVPTEGCKVPTVMVKTDNGATQAIEYKKGLRFLVYQENPSSFVQNLELRPLMFIRNVTSNIMGSSSKTDSSNTWRYLNPDVQMNVTNVGTQSDNVKPILFLVKPFKPSAVIVLPSRELEPGLYRFTGKDFAAQGSVYFWSGDQATAEAAKCLDIESFPPITTNYKPCEGDGNTKSSSSASTPPQAPLSSEQANLLGKLVPLSQRFNEARVSGDKSALEEVLATNFNYYDQRFDKSTDRAKFIDKAKKGNVASFNCHNYRLDREPAGMPILKGICEFKSHALLGMVDMSGTFSITFESVDGAWKISTFQVNAIPVR